MKNIITRLWRMTSGDNEIFVSSPPGREAIEFYRHGDIFIPAPSDEHFDDEEQKINAVRIRGKKDSVTVAEEWMTSEFNQARRPCITFKRRSSYKQQIEAILATTCSDYVFFSKNLECAFLYRDRFRKIVVMEIEQIPSREKIRQGWNKWVNQISVFAESTRYFVEQINTDFLEIYTMGISSHEMKKLLDAGFQWNRNKQTWYGKGDKVNVEVLENLIREDSLPSPSMMGVIPLWYCERDNSDASLEDYFQKKQGGDAIWNLLFGFGKME